MLHKDFKDGAQLVDPRAYKQLVERIGSSIEDGRRLAVHQINSVLVATYWCVGRWIVEFEQKGEKRAVYGESGMKRLSSDLSRKFGKGWGVNHLRDIRQFYVTYIDYKKHHALRGVSGHITESVDCDQLKKFSEHFPLSWTSYRLLMRIELSEKKAFYERESISGDWSSRQLERQIQSMLYERTALSKRKTSVIQKAHANSIVVRPEDEVKDPYVLDFLGLKDEYSESDLEDALIHHLESFLLELGAGFAFIARQKRFMAGAKHCRIDLLLYHRILRCLVLVDLKIGEFNHADAGQMNFYLNWAKREAMLPGENEPVGLILCAGKDKTYVQYALGDLSSKIFVSDYKLRLPRAEELRKEVRRGRNNFLEQQPSSSARLSETKNAKRKLG